MTADHGLTSAEARRLLEQHGPNELDQAPPPSAWAILASQFRSPLVLILLGACGVSVALKEGVDAVAIGAIVVLNALVGFVQEFRAERALQALRNLTAPRARVLRDGRAQVIAASDVVVGDHLLLEAGDIVAADARLRTAHRLSANEALLTGESAPVEKSTKPTAPRTALAERTSEVFLGTSIAAGTGIAIVAATGMKTELGKIARLLESVEEEATPLQQRLGAVSRTLLFACLGLVAIIAAVGLARGGSAAEVLLASISLAVAAVPEGLPAIVTIALAIGVRRMAKRHVLIRKMHAVETLGSLTVICTDKTGTLTTGVMSVRELWAKDPTRLLDAAAACCDAELGASSEGGVGDPTELALLRAAAERGIHRSDIERLRPRTHVAPFDFERKRMSILRADGVLYVKGAVETVLPLASSATEAAAAENARMAAAGLRVLAVATGRSEREADLELVGLVGIADPPRPEAKTAVAEARQAGIKTVMITGDHPATARSIATELGILHPLDGHAAVHARVTPDAKLGIVKEWKAAGEIVAMTGDGVNDAPALAEAHVGIAMGKTGTEVTREASDIVLTDDNFASIVAGVREGRNVYLNIRKALVYLLAGNAGELTLMLTAALVGLGLPLVPLQLLWINLMTDGFPALALVMDPPDGDLLRRRPRPPSEPILGRQEWSAIAFIGAVEGVLALGAYLWGAGAGEGHVAHGRSMAFTMLVFCQLFRSFAHRSDRRVLWELGAMSNLALVGVVGASVALQLGLMAIPAARALFQMSEISLSNVAACAAVALGWVSILEVAKLARRANTRRRQRAASTPSSAA